MPEKKIIVVGAGAAGLLAAGRAAEMGADVLLLERMDRPGRKLRITGKGRCNLTNTLPRREFLKHFAPADRFLKHAFYTFFSDDLIMLLDRYGVPVIEERGGRVFPESEDAQDVVDALLRYCRSAGVTMKSGVRVKEIKKGGSGGFQVLSDAGENFHSDALIITTGGKSYPATGSTGDGYSFARSQGHTITPLLPALVPLDTIGDAAQRMQGLSLRNANVSLLFDGKKVAEEFGEMLFTHSGVSGPIILTLSKKAVQGLANGHKVELSIDLKPALDEKKMDARLLRDLNDHGTKQYQSLLRALLPRLMVDIALEQTGIDPEKQANQITGEERQILRKWLKDFRLEVTGHRPISQAIVTAGGIAIAEINPQTMESKLVPGLYFAGEVLDIDADTGGFNLQAAFSTGWLAGQSAAEG